MFTVCLRSNSLPSSGPFPGKDVRGYLANQCELHIKRQVQGPQWETPTSSFRPRLREAQACVCLCSVAKSGLALCDPTDCGSPGSSVHGMLQARVLEWVAISSSRGSS